MVTILISIIIGAITRYLIFKEKNDFEVDGWGEFNKIMDLFIGGLIGLILGFFIAGIIPHNNQFYKKYEKNIISVSKRPHVGRSSYLYHENKGRKVEFYYQYKIKNGYKIENIDAKNTIIKYIDDNEKQRIVCYSNKPEELINLFSINFIKEQKQKIIYLHESNIKEPFH